MISEKGVRSGTEDVEHPIFSIESKHGKAPVSAFISKAYAQAQKNAPVDKVPMVVLHQTNSKHYYAFLDLEHLMGLLNGDSVDDSVFSDVVDGEEEEECISGIIFKDKKRMWQEDCASNNQDADYQAG